MSLLKVRLEFGFVEVVQVGFCFGECLKPLEILTGLCDVDLGYKHSCNFDVGEGCLATYQVMAFSLSVVIKPLLKYLEELGKQFVFVLLDQIRFGDGVLVHLGAVELGEYILKSCDNGLAEIGLVSINRVEALAHANHLEDCVGLAVVLAVHF